MAAHINAPGRCVHNTVCLILQLSSYQAAAAEKKKRKKEDSEFYYLTGVVMIWSPVSRNY